MEELWHPACRGVNYNILPSFMVASHCKHKAGLIKIFVPGNVWRYSTLCVCSVSKHISPSLQVLIAHSSSIMNYKWPPKGLGWFRSQEGLLRLMLSTGEIEVQMISTISEPLTPQGG